MSERDTVLDAVARRLVGTDPGHPLRVGIDGVCGAGKTTFARELADRVSGLGRATIRLDSDGFHHVRARRHRQTDPARGYYEDAYDFDSLHDLVLLPLGPGGSRRYATRVHDLTTDEIVREFATAPADAIVLFDATFLQRDDLRGDWDEVIYLSTSTGAARARGVARDAAALGGHDRAVEAYETRYLAACRIYLAEQDPEQHASIVIAHDDPAHPVLVATDAHPAAADPDHEEYS